MRRVILMVAALGAVLLLPEWGAAEETTGRWTWGLAAGFPQTLALTAERHGVSPARFQIHAGTFLVASSLGARVVLISPQRGLAPYGFFGAGLLHVAEGEGGGGTGLTGYAWVGAGARIRTGPLTWFGEIGAVFGMDTGKGYESASPAGAIGVGFGR